MPVTESVTAWLWQTAATSFVLFGMGSIAALLWRQPVRRMWVILLTFAACFTAPLVSLIPGLPQWSVPLVATSPLPQSEVCNSPSTIAVSVPAPFPAGATEEADVVADTHVAGASATLSEAAPEDAHQNSASSENTAVDVLAAGVAADERDFPATPSIVNPSNSQPAPTGGIAPYRSPAGVSRPSFSIVPIPFSLPSPRHLAAAYFIGLSAMAAWWLVGLAGLLRVLRGAKPAPAWCRDVLRDIAGPAGDRVRLLASPRAVQPFTFTWLRPVIVLPTGMTVETGATVVAPQSLPSSSSNLHAPSALVSPRHVPLRCALAHEWSHVARRDTLVWSLAGVVRLVHYYQPLCWWMRGQLRLCQDYLADAVAARETSNAAYAEFLATRALGRPLALGLGVAASRSDLYRRVAMLVENERALDNRCPRVWSAGTAAIAAGVVALVGTFGGRVDNMAIANQPADLVDTAALVAADIESPLAVQPDEQAEAVAHEVADATDEADERFLRGMMPPAPAAKTVKTGELGAESTEFNPANPFELDKQDIIDRMLEQARAIESGRFEYTTTQVREAADGTHHTIETHNVLVFSGDDWILHSTWEGTGNYSYTVKHAGRSLRFHVNRLPEGSTRPFVTTLHIDWPQAGAAGHPWGSPVRHAAEFAARNPEQLRWLDDDVVNGMSVYVVEYALTESEASRYFHSPTTASGTGIMRLYIAPALNCSIIRLRHCDQFGLAQSSYDIGEFKEVIPGVLLGQVVDQRGRDVTLRNKLSNVADINQPIAAREFEHAIQIPAGTQVYDRRAHRGDWFGTLEKPAFDPRKYPLRQFTTSVDEPDGLPPAALAEMDRDVLTREEWQAEWKRFNEQRQSTLPEKSKTKDGNKPKSSAQVKTPEPRPASKEIAGAVVSTPPAARSDAKASYRYAGKTWEQWRSTLLEDLDANTRVKALDAASAFAGAGYADEVAGAIREMLPTDQPKLNGYKVQQAACAAARCCGRAGVSVLESQLASSNFKVRSYAFDELYRMAAANDAVIPALLKATKDEGDIRLRAYRSLAEHHMSDPRVAQAVTSALDSDDDPEVTWAILDEFTKGNATVKEFPASPISRLLAHGDSRRRGTAAVVLALRGPATQELSARIIGALRDDHDMRRFFVDYLSERSTSVPRATFRLLVPALMTVIELETTDPERPGTHPRYDALAVLKHVPLVGEGWNAVPLLVQAVDGKLPDRSTKLRLAALDVLAHAGPAASSALPTLQRLLREAADQEVPANEAAAKSAREWKWRLEEAIRRIEGKQ